jgi:membrane protein implicated in regulation of membrane protease activity
MLTLTYILFSVAGCAYIVLSGLFGGLGESDAAGGGADAGGDAGADYGVEGGGHGAVLATDVASASFHFPLFSPLALATLFAAVGGYGLLTKHGFGAGDGASLLVSVPAAVATTYAVTYAGWRLMSSSRTSSRIRADDFVGAPGEVLTPIPAGGVGEVAAMLGSQRFTAPAREVTGRAVPRGASVRVVRLLGSTLVVDAGQAS